MYNIFFVCFFFLSTGNNWYYNFTRAKTTTTCDACLDLCLRASIPANTRENYQREGLKKLAPARKKLNFRANFSIHVYE